MARRPEPDPMTWWERYGHRLEGPPVPTRATDPPPTAPPPADPPPTAPEPHEHAVPHEHTVLHEYAVLREADVLRPRIPRPRSGWRRVLHDVTGGRVAPGPGRAEERHAALLERIRGPLTGVHRVAVLSVKGGVGKTTVAAGLGLALAGHRGDRTVVLDADPDAGTLADRLTGDSLTTVRDLLDDIEKIGSWSDVSRYLGLVGRLSVLASEQDPAAGEAFRRDEYERVCDLLGRYFTVLVTDSGTGLVHSAMAGTLARADSVVVVGAPTVDGAGRAAKTLDLLVAHGCENLARDAVVVLSCDRHSADVDSARILDHFRGRVRGVVAVPHDPHLAVGGRIDPERLRPATADAFLELGALVADAFDLRRRD
ncbi:MinD/ParA family ATP-binding protein [Pseudonocardia parietis]|uniref:MinD-like ATPase involved in chromosome partitioning or flagellar assembly n=1 Tax=Pseudonocardia parietis TaxID=570936 RepID=A0ABS4W2F4_9PSEU|nr:MinD/ParA family protein [Pseudonocardia parietis]MBP2370133.1 MinD-like ATPase involved in chromosome partitioning or flagellar assembly [Pseudonocardia parietis]